MGDVLLSGFSPDGRLAALHLELDDGRLVPIAGKARHRCNTYCGDGLHAAVAHSDNIALGIGLTWQYPGLGLVELVRVEPAHEAPAGVGAAAGRPAWLCFWGPVKDPSAV